MVLTKLFAVEEEIAHGHFLEEIVEVALSFFVDFFLMFQQQVFAGQTGDQASRPRLDHDSPHVYELAEPSPCLKLTVPV